jgi:hypothetical protein
MDERDIYASSCISPRLYLSPVYTHRSAESMPSSTDNDNVTVQPFFNTKYTVNALVDNYW